MKLTKCVNGHFYDEEKFEGCPHCAGGSKLDVNAIFGGTPSAPKPAMSKVERDDDMTVPLEWTPMEKPATETPAVEPVPASVETVIPVAAGIPATESVTSAAVGTPVTESVSSAAAGTSAPETVSSVVTEIPAAESVTSAAAGTSAPETVLSVVTEIPAAESESPGTSAGSSANTAEEGMPSDVESVVDIHSQPSFDTPLDFDAGFAKGESTVDEEGPTEEPEEEFELLSKFDSDQVDPEESEVTMEPEPFVVPEPKAVAEPGLFVSPEPEAVAEPGPFVSPESETVAEPGPFVVPESEAVAKPEPFVSPEPEAVAKPEPFVSPEPEAVAKTDPFAAPEPGSFVASKTVGATWEVPQPNVEEIPTGDSLRTSAPVDPELEDKPTEIVDIEEELVNGIKETPEPGPFVTPQPTASISGAALTAETPDSQGSTPAATMFGASIDNDDDEHTVAFYDEIFVSKAPAAPVVPEAETPASALPIPGASVADTAPVSEPAAKIPGDTAKVSEPDVFTAPPLRPAQVLPTPCVGWLIALNGTHIGQDFHLRVGKNYIGRDAGMDIVLSGDKSVSRNKHAIVIYEPKHHKYYIQPGESNELVYVNDEVVLLPMPLKAYDIIVIGDIELWFMPLCDDQHNWSEVIRKLQEQM